MLGADPRAWSQCSQPRRDAAKPGRWEGGWGEGVLSQFRVVRFLLEGPVVPRDYEVDPLKLGPLPECTFGAL